MFNELVQRSEQVFFAGDSSTLEDRLINLPSFLEALASIVKHMDAVSIMNKPSVPQRFIFCNVLERYRCPTCF